MGAASRSARSRQKRRSTRRKPATAKLKPQSQLKLVGTPQRRIDALDVVTGRKQFAMDLDVPGALPTMLCRPPTINGSAQSVRNLAAVQAMPGITDVAIIPHTSFVAGGVAVRGKTFGQCIDAIDALDVVWGPGTADGKSDDDVLCRPAQGRAATDSRGPAHQSARPDVHVLLPAGRSARDQLRRRRRQGRQRRGLVEPEVADLGPGAARDDPRHAGLEHQGPRGPGRRLVRAPPVQRRRVRGGGGLAEAGQAGEADVASHRQLPPGPLAPDVDQPRADRTRRRQRRELRPASHQRRDGLLDGLRRAVDRDARDASRGQLAGLLADDLHPHPERAVQLRRGHAAAERGLRVRHVQHRQRPQHLQPQRVHGDRADGRPGGQGDGPGPLQVPPLVRARRPHARGARQGRPGRELGPLDAVGHGAGDRDPQRVQGTRGVPGRDRLHPGHRQPQGQGRFHRAAGHQGRVRGRRRPADQSARSRGADDGRDHGRDRAGAHLQPAPGPRPLPRGQLGQRVLHASVELPVRRAGDRDAADDEQSRRRGRVRRRRLDGGRGVRVRAGDRNAAHELPDQSQPATRLHPLPDRPAAARLPDRRPAF